MNNSTFYSIAFSQHFGSTVKVLNISPVAGGCINNTSCVETTQGYFFIKVNSIEYLDLFEKEVQGLKLLNERSDIGIPSVHGLGTVDGKSYLILDWIKKGVPTDSFWHQFGLNLALQHKQSSADFGLDHDNHIGRLHQSNTFHNSWFDFFIQERLEPQVFLASKANLLDDSIRQKFERLYKKLDQLIPTEDPSLLHGDLWSGNFLCGKESRPYVFDPAVYFGHRETELAFTTMFGGFDDAFYKAYHENFPLQEGYRDRIDLHNLYPLLVHLNLFGSSYLSGIKSTLNKYV